MLLSDLEIIEKLKIKPADRVLDIGGSMTQHSSIHVDTLIDIIRPEEAPYGASTLSADNFVQVDITKNKLPFPDKSFDVCLCTHVLEDLPNPFLVMEEMMRVAKMGLIVTPSMGYDMVFTHIDYTDWLTGARRVPGQAHHKWFFINNGTGISVLPKNYPVLYTKDFQSTGWSGEKEMEYYWKDKIIYSEFSSLNIHDLIDEYTRFINKNKNKIKFGQVVVFLDNPFNSIRATIKLLLKRGAGYKYRNEKIH